MGGGCIICLLFLNKMYYKKKKKYQWLVQDRRVFSRGRQSEERVNDQINEPAADRILGYQQAEDTPASLFMLSVLLCAVLETSAEVDEVLLHRTPTQRIDAAGLLMSNKVQYRTVLQRKAL